MSNTTRKDPLRVGRLEMLLLSRKGLEATCAVHRFFDEGVWQGIYCQVTEMGWSPPSESEVAWLESPLSQYRPGSFFTKPDAEDFAHALERFGSKLAQGAPEDVRSALPELGKIFREGAVFVWAGALKKTVGTDFMEVIHVYLCPQCGFMSHGSWLYSLSESSPDEIRSSVEAILAHKYCPLCDCRRVLSEAFVLPQLDPESLDPVQSSGP